MLRGRAFGLRNLADHHRFRFERTGYGLFITFLIIVETLLFQILTHGKLHCNSSRMKAYDSLSLRKSWSTVILLVRSAKLSDNLLSRFDLPVVWLRSIWRITASSLYRFLISSINVPWVRVNGDKFSFLVRYGVKGRVDIICHRGSLRPSLSGRLLIIRDGASIHGSSDVRRLFASQVRSRSHLTDLVGIV